MPRLTKMENRGPYHWVLKCPVFLKPTVSGLISRIRWQGSSGIWRLLELDACEHLRFLYKVLAAAFPHFGTDLLLPNTA